VELSLEEGIHCMLHKSQKLFASAGYDPHCPMFDRGEEPMSSVTSELVAYLRFSRPCRSVVSGLVAIRICGAQFYVTLGSEGCFKSGLEVCSHDNR